MTNVVNKIVTIEFMIFYTLTAFAQDTSTNELKAIQMVFSQIKELDKYYAVDKTIKQNRVKGSISSWLNMSFFSDSKMKTEYDSLGRDTLWYDVTSTSKSYTRFIQEKDTLFKISDLSEGIDRWPYEFEKLVYNNRGAVVFYASCRQSTPRRKVEADLTRFFYDHVGRLSSVHHYSTVDYPFPISMNFPVIDSLFSLSNIKNYYYNKSSQLIKTTDDWQKGERDIDSFFYDSNGRLKRQTSF